MQEKKYTTAVRWAIILPVAALAVLALAAGVFLRTSARLDTPPPGARGAPLAPLDLPASTVAMPVSVPLEAIGGELNRAAPPSISGAQDGPLGSRLNWRVTRSPIAVTGANGALRISGDLNGGLSIESWAGSAQVDLKARYHMDSRPRMLRNWRLDPNLSVELSLDQATHRLFGRIDISLRRTIGPPLERALRAQLERLQTHIAGDDSIERVVRELWTRLCTSVRILSDPEIWLEIRPGGLSAGQVRIDGKAISLPLALQARTMIGTRNTTPRCVFPERLEIGGPEPDEPEAASIELWLPVETGYGELREALERSAVGRSFGDSWPVTLDAARAEARGRSLLLEANFRPQAPEWLSKRGKVSAYLVAEPVLDPEAATITLTRLAIDTASSHAVAAVLGELGERRFLASLGSPPAFDLSEWQEQLRGRANQALADLGLLSASADNVAIAAQLDDLRLVRLEVGPDSVRAVARATGSARITIERLAPIALEQLGS